ncbi:MAG TPA: copper amine oxidase N-terminal domain-containing protein [Caldisericia bacterium]|nr:copper amine oxidase N-terminal domain-containing protein [Caldisericia bacterium]
MKNMTCTLLRVLVIVSLLSPVLLSQSQAKSFNFDLEATGECRFITLTWNPVPKAEFYSIYRGRSKDDIHPMPLTDFPIQDTSYVDQNDIILGQEYFYYVSAIGLDKKEFAKSSIVSATPFCEENKPSHPCKLGLKYQVGNPLYWINDDSHGPMETSPMIRNSRMFLVIRYVTQAIPGTQIFWEGMTQKVTIITRSGDTIELWIGKYDARINGQWEAIDPNNKQVIPFLKEGRTLLPLRFVCEKLGAESIEDIQWDATTQTVEIFVDDPECEKEGFRYPKARSLQGSFYEFSVEYHSQSDKLPNEVKLELLKSDNSKTLEINPGKPSKQDLKLEAVKTPKPSTEEIKSSFKKAQRYHFRMELDPAMLHFYRFSADLHEKHPSEGYLGPIYSKLPHSQDLKELDLPRIEDGTSLTLQGYFTTEPYPRLVKDYSDVNELEQKINSNFLLQLDHGQKIEEGSYICVKVEKRTINKKIPILKLNKLVFYQKIRSKKYQANEIIMETPPLLTQNQHRFAIIYSGCIDKAEVEDSEGINQVYRRARADFTGEMLNIYKTSFSMAIPKNNIYVNFGRGDEEIDEICADDGDGNPFDFDWDDAEYRNTMERDAERWWRMDDGWRIRRGTRAALYNSILEINAKIRGLAPDITPEIYFFVFTHGSVAGLCSYEDGGMLYENLVNRLTPLMENSITSLNARSKIRFMNNTCKAGAILPYVEDTFRLSGQDYFQLAVSSQENELSWGQWPDHSETSYASAGGTFGLPFLTSLEQQAKSNAKRAVDWKLAYDYAATHDVYVTGVEHERDDGSKVMVFVNPQYWYSRDRNLFQRGPAYEEPLSPEQEILLNQCRIGVDTSEVSFDICNCSMTPTTPFPKASFNVVNRGIVPLSIVEIVADESVLSKASTYPAMVFLANDYDSCHEQYPMNVPLRYTDSFTFEICLHASRLNAQPLDENGYMAKENNLPLFIQVPISIVYESNSRRYSQTAYVPLRVRAESYQLSYQTSIKRSETVKGKLSEWEALETSCIVTPRIEGLPNYIISGPSNTENIHMKISTDIFKQSNAQNLIYGFIQEFKLELKFDFMGEGTDCMGQRESSSGGGTIISASMPSKLKGMLEVPYTLYLPTEKIPILIKPGAHSSDGLQALIGKHTFQFKIRRTAHFNCEYRQASSHIFDLTIDLEFTNPKT